MFTRFNRSARYGIAAIAFSLTVLAQSSFAQESQENGSNRPKPSRISGPIDGLNTVTLHDNVRKDLAQERDMGKVEDALPIRLFLVIKRTPEQQDDLTSLLSHQQELGGAEYHKWLTPKQYGERFGASQEETSKLTAWLESRGFKVNGVLNNRSMIDFSGTAGGIRDTFKTEMRYWNFDGGKYAANAQDPRIPAAIESMVSGIAGLSKFPSGTTTRHRVRSPTIL